MPFALRQRSLGSINSKENFRARSLTCFSQGEGLLEGVFVALLPSTLNGLPDKCFLAGYKMCFHRVERRGIRSECQLPKVVFRLDREIDIFFYNSSVSDCVATGGELE